MPAPRRIAASDFARNLELAMRARGFTRASLGRTIGRDKATIGRWLSRGEGPSDPNDIKSLENELKVGGLLLPHERFIEANRLYESYPGMEYFPITTDNADTTGVFENRLMDCLNRTTRTVHYTHLCQFAIKKGAETDFDPLRPQFTPREFEQTPFLNRLLSRQIAWERIEVFYSLARLIQTLKSQILLRGTQYQVKYYPKPPKSFPVINMRSFDHKAFLIGGYDPHPVYHENCIFLNDTEPLRSFFRRYWETVWVVGEPLHLSFENSYQIAKSIKNNLTKLEWNNITEKIQEETTPLSVKSC